MIRDPHALLGAVRAALNAVAPNLTEIRPIGGGLEFAVFAGSLEGDPVAIKTPWTRRVENANDPSHDSRDLLRQEAHLLRFTRSHGVAAPEVIGLHIEGEVDLIITTLLLDDGSPPQAEDLAVTLAAVHDAPTPDIDPISQRGTFGATLAERIVRRVGVVEQLCDLRLELPPVSMLEAIVNAAEDQRSLLHLDVRDANLLTQRGKICGLIDWTNALLGDPTLELARISEYSSAPPGFFEAYARRRRVQTTKVRELIYRLDAAAMLAVVFLSEAPDPKRAGRQVVRTVELVEALTAHVTAGGAGLDSPDLPVTALGNSPRAARTEGKGRSGSAAPAPRR